MGTKLKILYFNYLYDLYGVSIGSTIKAEKLMAALANCGHEVKIYWRKRQTSFAEGTGQNFRIVLKKLLSKYVHDVKILFSNIKYIIEEFKIVKKEKPDLIIARLDLYLFSALVVSKIKQIPLIIEADAPCVYEAREFHKQFWSFPWLPELIEKINLLQADLSVCVSHQAKKYFLNYGIPENKLKVITNGADTKNFHDKINTDKIVKKYFLKDKIVIGFVGSFHIWHGVDNLINLIKEIIQSQNQVTFLLVGKGGPRQGELERFIDENNLLAQVKMIGYISHVEIPQFIAAMDIVVAPYPQLDFFYYSPVKIFEYMACGKPVLTSKIGQIAEIIVDGQNGFLCKPGDREEIFQKLSRLIEDTYLREVMGENARKTIISNFSWQQKGSEWSQHCIETVAKFNNGKIL